MPVPHFMISFASDLHKVTWFEAGHHPVYPVVWGVQTLILSQTIHLSRLFEFLKNRILQSTTTFNKKSHMFSRNSAKSYGVFGLQQISFTFYANSNNMRQSCTLYEWSACKCMYMISRLNLKVWAVFFFYCPNLVVWVFVDWRNK